LRCRSSAATGRRARPRGGVGKDAGAFTASAKAEAAFSAASRTIVTIWSRLAWTDSPSTPDVDRPGQEGVWLLTAAADPDRQHLLAAAGQGVDADLGDGADLGRNLVVELLGGGGGIGDAGDGALLERAGADVDGAALAVRQGDHVAQNVAAAGPLGGQVLVERLGEGVAVGPRRGQFVEFGRRRAGAVEVVAEERL
jgi:hypothetical protein